MFTGKTVIVTGGANGIGRSIVHAYAEQGANVVIADIVDGSAEAVQYNRGVRFIETDVRDEQSIIRLMDETVATFGSIDIVINNAGKGKWLHPFDLTVEQFDDIYATNLRSVFICSKEAAKRMKNGGSIVNMASTRAFMSEPNSESYAASKGGIIALTHALASSFSELSIHVNSISPGWIETGDYDALRTIDHAQHLSKRVGKPEDVARACLYLTNPSNNFVNATNIVIDGGMTAKMIYEED